MAVFVASPPVAGRRTWWGEAVGVAASVASVLRQARDFIREGLDAHRQGKAFSASRQYGMAWVSIGGAWVRVKLNDESRGLDIDEAAAIAGVGGNPIGVPPPPPFRPRLPTPIELLPDVGVPRFPRIRPWPETPFPPHEREGPEFPARGDW